MQLTTFRRLSAASTEKRGVHKLQAVQDEQTESERQPLVGSDHTDSAADPAAADVQTAQRTPRLLSQQHQHDALAARNSMSPPEMSSARQVTSVLVSFWGISVPRLQVKAPHRFLKHRPAAVKGRQLMHTLLTCRSSIFHLAGRRLQQQISSLVRSAPPLSRRCHERLTWRTHTPSALPPQPLPACQRQQPMLRRSCRVCIPWMCQQVQTQVQQQLQQQRRPPPSQMLCPPAAVPGQSGAQMAAAGRRGRSRRRRIWWSSAPCH